MCFDLIYLLQHHRLLNTVVAWYVFCYTFIEIFCLIFHARFLYNKFHYLLLLVAINNIHQFLMQFIFMCTHKNATEKVLLVFYVHIITQLM